MEWYDWKGGGKDEGGVGGWEDFVLALIQTPLLLATHPSTTNYIHDPFAVCSG